VNQVDSRVFHVVSRGAQGAPFAAPNGWRASCSVSGQRNPSCTSRRSTTLPRSR
jgi:hypothetical protein